MGQINLYKIDRNKKEIFLDALNEKFEFLGEQDVQIEKEGGYLYIYRINLCE